MRFFIVILLLLLSFKSFAAPKFSGNVDFVSSGNLVSFTCPQVYNSSYIYTTGNIGLIIYGTYVPYYGVTPSIGTVLWTEVSNATLSPGAYLNRNTSTVLLNDAPTNYNYLFVGLYEYLNGIWYLSDYRTVAVSAYFSPPVVVQPPSVGSVDKTDLGITYDRYASYYLSVNASGDGLSYQWQYSAYGSSWENVQDAMAYYYSSSNNSYNYPNSSVLNLENVGMQNSTFNGSYDRWPFFKYGYYRVVVSNSGGSTTSQSVYIGEYSPPPPPPPSDSDGDGIADNEDQFPYDYDNDGINDSYETNTGTYVSATDTGTDPNVSDTDSDGIGDGYETNTGTFLSSSDTGTNPNIYDTDGDGINDLDDYAPNNFAIQAPSLSISQSGDDIIITWPNNTGFELKYSTDLSSWFSTGVSQGSYTETIDAAKFFMLSKN